MKVSVDVGHRTGHWFALNEMLNRHFGIGLATREQPGHFIAMPWGRAGPVLKAVLKSSLNRLSSVRVSCVTLRT